MATEVRTRLTLIQRAKEPQNHEAWLEFVDYYRRFIGYVLQHMRVPENDIEDLSQEILVKLWKKLPEYEKRQAKFRTWLSSVIRNCAVSYFRATRQKNKLFTDAEDIERLTNVKEAEIDRIVELEWKDHLTQLAMTRMEKAYHGKSIEVFLLSLAGHSTDEIKERLGLTTDSVYTLKNRMKKSFVQQVKQLIDELEF